MKILITGAGGAAAISFFNAIKDTPNIEVYMADMDRLSSGLYLVDKTRRVLLPAGDSLDYTAKVLSFCVENNIAFVLPTVDCELTPLANNCLDFCHEGIRLLLSPEHALLTCYDKYHLMQTLDGSVELAQYAVYKEGFNLADFKYPFIAKPRIGAGSRGIHLIKRKKQLAGIPQDGSYLIQEYLPGTEFSVDVYINAQGETLSSVVRERMKVDSGVAVIARSVVNDQLSALAGKIAQQVGIRYVANVQFKQDELGVPRLLEINPRFPGTMPLTVAAGVNMPLMCIQELRGEPVKPISSYQEIVMVRSWQETYINQSSFSIAAC